MQGQDNDHQLILNIYGAAGVGKSFFINTVRRSLSNEELDEDGFVQAATPFATAAGLINRKTQHSLLHLPVGTSKCLPLHGERLKGVQDTFSVEKYSQYSANPSRKQAHTTRTNHLEISHWSSWVTSSSCRQPAILRCSRQMLLIPADTTYTSFLTKPPPSPNLCDSKEQTKQNAGPN